MRFVVACLDEREAALLDGAYPREQERAVFVRRAVLDGLCAPRAPWWRMRLDRLLRRAGYELRRVDA